MKTAFTLLLTIATGSLISLHATNHTNNGGAQAYSLNNGDTLRIAGNTFSGNINSFTNGAVIVISSSAIFKPTSMTSPNGKIINYGVAEFNSLSTSSKFAFDNYNLLVVKGDLNLYDGGTQVWNNFAMGVIKVSGNFFMNNADFTNYATMSVGNNVALYANTSNYINRGTLNIGGDVAINKGVFTNENYVVAQNFSGYAGKVVNAGEIAPRGTMTFNTDGVYENKCLLVTGEGFTNYGSFANNGLLWVGRTGTATDQFYNSGTFTNAANAGVRSVKFINYNTLNGGGSYYVTGDSYSSGTVGRSGTTTDTIKVYDLTRTNAPRFFDTQWGTVYNNVVFRAFAQPDTNAVSYAGCSSYYRVNGGTVLPVEWTGFEVKAEQNTPVISWSAQFEANMKFDIEHSLDNVQFSTLSTLVSNTSKNYVYTDRSALANVKHYYRIKATSAVNGAVKYTETKAVQIGALVVANLSVYPNPVAGVATIQFGAQVAEKLTLRVRHANGQQVMARQVTAAKGQNSVSLTEAAQLQAGVYFVEISNSTAVISSQRFIKN